MAKSRTQRRSPHGHGQGTHHSRPQAAQELRLDGGAARHRPRRAPRRGARRHGSVWLGEVDADPLPCGCPFAGRGDRGDRRGRPRRALGRRSCQRFRLERIGFVFQFGQLLPDLNAVRQRRVAATHGRAWAERRRPHRRANGSIASTWPTRPRRCQATCREVRRSASRSPGRLATNPGVIFADEPTGSLDSVAAENVLTAMLEAVREAGTTVVLITHDPRTAAYADREVIVRDGQLSAVSRGVEV